jgi:hypothetical protein
MKSDNAIQIDELLKTVHTYFSKKKLEEMLPNIIRYSDKWMVINGGWYWALFYLSFKSEKRIQEYQKKKWHPFPALFSNVENGPAAMRMTGQLGYFDSNSTVNGYAFDVGSESSFIIHNHHHVVSDSKGNEADYVVDYAFVVGKKFADNHKNLSDAFIPLFNKLLDIWKAKT